MRRFLSKLALAWLAFKKGCGRFYDVVLIGNQVTLKLIHASGPLEGQVAQEMRVGSNIVTSFLGATGSRGGRDVLRRLIIPTGFGDSILLDAGSAFSTMQLGSGTTAETSLDTSLDNAIAGTQKSVSAVTLDGTNPYVTFTVEYDETEANQTLAEIGMSSGNGDFVARKTFTSFTKTSQFRLIVEWEYRF